MRALFDVNALLALFDRDHVHHAAIRDWWSSNRRDGWATCAISQNGLVRIMSQPGYAWPRPIGEILNSLASGAAEVSHAFWPEDISIADKKVFDHGHLISHSQITDVYLLALAVKNGGRLVSFDKGIPLAAVRGAKKENLVRL
jgi:uncharacterized protein